MADWMNTLNLRDLWEASEANGKGTMPIEEVAKNVAKRLDKIKLPKEYEDEKEEIVYRFEDEVETLDDFNYILNDLYNLGDTPYGKSDTFAGQKKLIWISTF